MIPKEFLKSVAFQRKFETKQEEKEFAENEKEFREEIEMHRAELELYGDDFEMEDFQRPPGGVDKYQKLERELFNEGYSDEEIFESVMLIRVDDEYYKMQKGAVYFLGCPLSIYEQTYENRKNEFLKNNFNDYYEIDFIKSELSSFQNFQFYGSSKIHKEIKVSINRCEEFLLDMAKDIGYEFSKVAGVYEFCIGTDQSSDDIPLEIPSIDKIRLLIELGVIDFLKERSLDGHPMSANSLAKIVSKIIGVKHTTISRNINAYLNDSIRDKNYPLSENKLIEIHDIITRNKMKTRKM